MKHTRRLAPVLAALLALGCTDPIRSPFGPSFGRNGGGPSVTSTFPEEASQGTTLDVQVIGSGFDAGSQVRLLLAGQGDAKVRTNSTRFVSSRELVANITIDVDAEPAFRDVEVRTAGGKTGIGTEKFIVTVLAEPLPSPGGASAKGVAANGYIIGGSEGSCDFSGDAVVWTPARSFAYLPLLPGGCGSVVHDINSSGTAVGSVYFTSTNSVNVRWMLVGGSYTVEELPLLPDGSKPGGWSINSSGAIVAVNKAAVYDDATGWQLLAPPQGGTSCRARAINDNALIAGNCTVGGQTVAVAWTSRTSAAVVIPSPSGARSMFPNRMNSSGVIVGFAVYSAKRSIDVYRAVRWDPSGTNWIPTVLPDLGSGGTATDIDEAGNIAGGVTHRTYAERPVYWSANGTLQVLDSENGDGVANGLATDAQGLLIVGLMRTGNHGNATAVTWRP